MCSFFFWLNAAASVITIVTAGNLLCRRISRKRKRQHQSLKD